MWNHGRPTAQDDDDGVDKNLATFFCFLGCSSLRSTSSPQEDSLSGSPLPYKIRSRRRDRLLWDVCRDRFAPRSRPLFILPAESSTSKSASTSGGASNTHPSGSKSSRDEAPSSSGLLVHKGPGVLCYATKSDLTAVARVSFSCPGPLSVHNSAETSRPASPWRDQ